MYRIDGLNNCGSGTAPTLLVYPSGSYPLKYNSSTGALEQTPNDQLVQQGSEVKFKSVDIDSGVGKFDKDGTGNLSLQVSSGFVVKNSAQNLFSILGGNATIPNQLTVGPIVGPTIGVTDQKFLVKSNGGIQCGDIFTYGEVNCNNVVCEDIFTQGCNINTKTNDNTAFGTLTAGLTELTGLTVKSQPTDNTTTTVFKVNSAGEIIGIGTLPSVYPLNPTFESISCTGEISCAAITSTTYVSCGALNAGNGDITGGSLNLNAVGAPGNIVNNGYIYAAGKITTPMLEATEAKLNISSAYYGKFGVDGNFASFSINGVTFPSLTSASKTNVIAYDTTTKKISYMPYTPSQGLTVTGSGQYPLLYNSSTATLTQTPIDQKVDTNSNVTFDSIDCTGAITCAEFTSTTYVSCGALNAGNGFITGGSLNVTGNVAGGALSSVGVITGATLNLSGNASCGALNAGTGTITGGTLNLSGNASCGALNAGTGTITGGTINLTGTTATLNAKQSFIGQYNTVLPSGGYGGAMKCDASWMYFTADSSATQGLYMNGSGVCRLSSYNNYVETYVNGSSTSQFNKTFTNMKVPLRLYSSVDGTFYCGLTASPTQNYTLTLPTALSSVADAPLTSSTTGVLSYNDQAVKKTSSVTFNDVSIGTSGSVASFNSTGIKLPTLASSTQSNIVGYNTTTGALTYQSVPSSISPTYVYFLPNVDLFGGTYTRCFTLSQSTGVFIDQSRVMLNSQLTFLNYGIVDNIVRSSTWVCSYSGFKIDGWGNTDTTYGFMKFPSTGVYGITWSFGANSNLNVYCQVNKNISANTFNTSTMVACDNPQSPGAQMSAYITIDSINDYVSFTCYNFNANQGINANGRQCLQIVKIN